MIRILFLWLALWASACAPAPASAAESAVVDSRLLLERAETSYDRGLSELVSGPERARASFAESAAAYRELVEAHGVRNARLLANLGNAYLLSADTGRAVLAFRRAQRIDPGDRIVRAGLETARLRVGTAIAPRGGALAWLEEWRSWVAPRSVLLVGALAWAGGWLGLAAGRFLPSARGLSRASTAAAILGGICLTTVLADSSLQRASRDAVVIAEAVGRNGPDGAAYEASFDRPLAAGVELTIIEERGAWARARLGDGRQTWLPVSALERV